jgi:GDPmannose 4,6-dehydratase
MNKTCLITGATGQDSSYLSELLLSKGYDVYGTIRRSSTSNTERIDHIFHPDLKGKLFYADLYDGIDTLLYEIKPDEVYNLAAMSHVRISFDIPIYTGSINGVGVTRILEGIRKLKLDTKFYQASSSEMFGTTPAPQNENSPFNPVSPYGCAKLYAYHIVRSYRTGYKMFACNGILFNHESERRGINFVTRKITKAAARIKLGLQTQIKLGNLDAIRDWGHAKDYMEAVWMIMQYDKPGDWVVSSGISYTVRQFFEDVFEYFELDPYKYLILDNSYIRPNEVPELCGDSTKIRKMLNWKPKIDYNMLVKLMCDNDLKEAEYERDKRSNK